MPEFYTLWLDRLNVAIIHRALLDATRSEEGDDPPTQQEIMEARSWLLGVGALVVQEYHNIDCTRVRMWVQQGCKRCK